VRASRAFALLSGIGLVSLVAYWSTTGSGRDLFDVPPPKFGEPDMFGDVATATWITLLIVSVLPTVLGELARRSMRLAERVESRRIIAAVVAGVALAFAAAYGSLSVFAAGKFDLEADFSFFRTARPSDGTRRMIDTRGDLLQAE
jgi:hypothetical protein